MRWFITKKHLVCLIGVLIAVILIILMNGCIPVTVRPQFDAEGLPVALPVTPVGSVNADGAMVPVYPVSNDAPTPVPSVPWGDLLNVALGVLGVAGGGYGLVLSRVLTKAKTALSITAQLADANAAAETDAEVDKNKQLAAQLQMAAGVRDLIQRVRGK